MLFPDQLVAAHSYDMATRGYSVLHGVLDPFLCNRLKAGLIAAARWIHCGNGKMRCEDRGERTC